MILTSTLLLLHIVAVHVLWNAQEAATEDPSAGALTQAAQARGVVF